MKSIPQIGKARGIFEIFVPGIFLLINFLLFFHFLPIKENMLKENILKYSLTNPVSSIIILIAFGYLIGVILRIIRTDKADKLSSNVLKRIDKNGRDEILEFKPYITDTFPYTNWIGIVCKDNLPPNVYKFYKKTWKNYTGRSFFNFIKIMLISQDNEVANEIYSAEAICRYISSMFYALFISSLILVPLIIYRSLALKIFQIELSIIFISYIVSIFLILKYFRFIRIKEVKTVFFASYRFKNIFKGTFKAANQS